MRVTVISIVLLICIILAAHGAPLDSRSPRAKALKIGSAKKAPLKAPKAKAATPVKIKTAKPVKAKAKPIKVKPAAKAKTTKVTSKAKATKPAAKKKTKAVANTKKAAPKAKSATVAKPTAVKVKSSTKAVKPKTAAIKPAAKTPAKTKATKAKTTKAPASKVGSTKATKAKASKTAVTKAKGANKTSAKAKTTATAKTSPAATTKKPASAKACAIKKSKTAGKTTKKARANTPPPADDGCEEVDICPEFDDCNTCVGVNAGCGFDFKTNKCVKAAGSVINPLAKNKQQCTSFANSQAEASASSDDAIIKAAALKFFNPKIASHIFVGEKTSKRSGRHILSVWTKDNKDSTVSDNTNLGTTGIVRFAIPSSKKTKTVWNDVAGNGARVFSQAQIQDICISALSASIKANSANKAALAGAGAADTGAASKSKKGKGKATPAPALKLLGGLDNAFVTPSPVGNLCVNVNEASCFPVSLKTVSGAIGSPCTGDDNEEGA